MSGYVLILQYFKHEKEIYTKYTDIMVKPDFTSVRSEVISVDFENKVLNVLVSIHLGESLRRNNSIDIPNQDIRLISNSNPDSILIKANQKISPIVLKIPFEGNNYYYPFDQYKSNLSIVLYKDSDYAKGLIWDKKTNTLQGGVVISGDMVSDLEMFLFEFKDIIVSDFWSDREQGIISRKIVFKRNKITRIYSVFVTVLFLLVMLSEILILVFVFSKKYKFEINLIVYLGIVLVGLPIIRNSQPGIPSVGIMTDYISYYWVLSATILSNTALLFGWFLRRF